MLNSMNQIWYGNILNEKREAKNGLHINNMIWNKCMRIWLNETNDLMRDAVKECEKHIIWGYIEWEKLQHNKNAYEIKGEWFVSVWNKMAKASGANLMPLHLKDWRKSLKEVEVWMRTTRNLWKRSLGVLKGKSQWWPRPHYSPWAQHQQFSD